MEMALRVSAVLLAGLISALLPGCGGGSVNPSSADNSSVPPLSSAIVGRGFPRSGPWLSFYGSSERIADLDRMAATFAIINIDADPDVGNFSAAQIRQLKAGGRNRVISYLNLGSCETFRSYWRHAPAGLRACRDNTKAILSSYSDYTDEVWMDLGDADYQRLILEHVAPRLVAQGVDGLFLDNMELVEHAADDPNGACNAHCRQGGLDLVRRLREKYPDLLIVMQNATSDVTRLGTTGGVPFASLLDGISHEQLTDNAEARAQLLKWQAMKLRAGDQSFWIGSEDYVGTCDHLDLARAAYQASTGLGFSASVTDASSNHRSVCYWPFLSTVLASTP